MNCCGMSSSINKKTNHENLIIPGLNISQANFTYLLIAVVFLTISSEIIIRLAEKKQSNIKNIFVVLLADSSIYLIGWAIMTISMTANVYLLLAIAISKSIAHILTISRSKSYATCCT